MTTEAKQVAAVTGATGAIGEAIARQIAAKPGYEVVLVCRNERKGELTRRRIQKATGNDHIRCEIVDLGLGASIQELAARWRCPLHVLVNNAAATPQRREETSEGLETQFATNIMGYFWMMQELGDALARSRPSRVVNVASYWAGNLDLDDLQFERRPYSNGMAYRQAKQADRMLSVAFAERFADKGVAVNACHPGDVNSALSNSLGFGGHQSPDDGANTPVWLATTDVGQENTGKYFEHLRQSSCPFGAKSGQVEQLYDICSRFAQ